jgi:cytochrome P450 family 710 subfamily A protein
MEVRHMWNQALSEAMAGFDWRWAIALVVITYAIYEQLSFMSKRKHLPGPSFVPPFVGNVISMVVDPTGFWDQQANAAKKVSNRISRIFFLGCW